MSLSALPASLEDIRALRDLFRAEVNGQIVHDSLHRRPGWTQSYSLVCDGAPVGYGSVAIAGPWAGKATVFEFYILPRHRSRAIDLFERFVKASRADSFEVHTSGELLTVMLHIYGGELESEKIVFRDQVTTALPAQGAVLYRTNSLKESRDHFLQREGSSEWSLMLEGDVVATGGIAFHYNPPYGDITMNVTEGYRRRGFGAYFVQELKRVAYELGCIPGARCDPANVASRRTLLKAGFAPSSHILLSSLSLRASSAPFAPSTPRR